jgi:hypothetical protein
VVDVLLDLGSTNSKYLVRTAGRVSAPMFKPTKALCKEWNLAPYNKAEFLADVTGAAFLRWVAQLLSAVRAYVATTQRGHLRSIHLALPQSPGLNVAGLATAFAPTARVSLPLDADAVKYLNESAAMNSIASSVSAPTIVLRQEHEVLAAHYLSVLQALHRTAISYRAAYLARELERQQQAEQARIWDRKRAAVEGYEQAGFWHKLLNSAPLPPSGDRPTISTALETPRDWMIRLINTPELLNRVVLLDAGGLSLDIAVMEFGEKVQSFGYSDDECGGESVTSHFFGRIHNRTPSSEDGTREKARLGDLWNRARQSGVIELEGLVRQTGGHTQLGYREATRQVYGRCLHNLAQRIAPKWARGERGVCTVLLTGGASRNPHFQDCVRDLFQQEGLDVDVVDAWKLDGLIEEARRFPVQHGVRLSSRAVVEFQRSHRWATSSTRGSDLMGYDKYAVIGGLLAQVNET